MRLKRVLAVGALLVMSASMAACGSGDKAGSDGDGRATGAGGTIAGAFGGDGDGNGKAAGGGLPSASTIADIVFYLNKYGSCLDLQAADEYDKTETANRDPSWGNEEAGEPAWAIKQRYVCRDNYEDTTTLLLADMKKFQGALKKSGSGYGFLVGKNFLVVPGGNETTHDLQKSDLKYLTCDPKFKLPSGYEKEPALVDGCVLTNYFPADI
ncbi:hypothetical protein AB0L75_05120 [Streptomyces sp. NPDC052101]|uniref:hypothetical protein n=1 Tax=Streptomyces sp. NPDC052101 TaxID=3155763 RepID=UPI003427DE3F